MPQPTLGGAVAASSSSSPPSAPDAASSSRRPDLVRPARLTSSSGSFYAGAPIPSFPTAYGGRAAHSSSNRRRRHLTGMRRQSTHKYHTFPTQPPKTPSDAPDSALLSPNSFSDADGGGRGGNKRRAASSGDGDGGATPLPIRQLALLAFLSICEQTALNSIGPYLPTMVANFPEIPDGQVGLYVGLLASAFALAQLLTNLLWGHLSDRVGRKPVMLLGTGLLMVCFAFFGFCQRFWQVLVVHAAMGLLNGNAAVVPTVLGEVTDRSNQSRAFTWLPVMYSLGGITGPALGGLLVGEVDGSRYPFLGPNVMSAASLFLAVVVLGIWFEETLEDAEGRRRLTGLGWAENLCHCACLGRIRGSRSPWNNPSRTDSRHDSPPREENGGLGHHGGYDEQGDAGEEEALLPDIESQEYASGEDDATEDGKDGDPSRRSALRQLLNWTTLSILFTYLIFQVANISFNSLYPIFASASPPTGRELGPGTIGVSMSLAGIVTILFQVSLFERIKARVGNLGTFRLSLLGLSLCMILMPWVGYQDQQGLFGWADGRSWLLAELGVILVLKNLSAVGGLSCVLLLVSRPLRRIPNQCADHIRVTIRQITNSAPSHETLGTLNGIAQTLSAAGRSFGPFTSGAVFTLSTRIRPKGEVLAWGLFGGVALVGWLWTLAIKGGNLESADFEGEDDHGSEDSVHEGVEGLGGGHDDHDERR